jgi:cysteine desulfurase/selenocysteine lyase
MSSTTSLPATLASGDALDVDRIRAEFPSLHQQVRGRPLVYLDNAASSQRPRVVADAVARYYAEYASNVHRGVHALAERATTAYEDGRAEVARFLNAADAREIVFTRGTTEAINLVAHSYARPRLRAGDEILVTGMEHHSNIVPWQLACEATGARLVVTPIDERGEIDLSDFERRLSERTRLVSVVWISNALGTVNPVEEIVRLAHARGVPVLLDAAQAAPHRAIDVRALGCDFLAFSGHKTYSPGGIGALYGRLALLEDMAPFQGGGDMILSVSFERTTFNHPPYRFEAGTPNVEGAIGLAAGLRWLGNVGLERVERHESALVAAAVERLRAVRGVRLIGDARRRAGVVSFVVEGAHAHDVGTVLDGEGVAVRAGHHCAQPAMARFGVPATVRASFAVYNRDSELDALVRGIERARALFS